MKNKSFIQKLSLLTLSLFFAGSLFGKTLTVDPKGFWVSAMSEVRHSFKHSFSHLNQKGADDHIIEQSGIKKYSEWQNPPITYYGPSANNQEAKLTYMYSFKGTVKEAKLKLRLWAWNWGTNTFGEGSAWVSKDGKDWIKILSRANPISGGKTSLFHESLPNEVLGGNELFLQIRLNVYNSSVGSYTNSQFGRADSNSKEEIFSIDVEYATIECKDIFIPDPKSDGRKEIKELKFESTNPNDGRPTPRPLPGTGGLTPPDPDYKDTIAELKRLLAEKDKKLAHCEKEMAAKNQEIETLQGKVSGLEKQVTSLETNNEELKGQIQNLREDNQNLNYEITVTNEHLEKAIQVAETPFINGWVYDPERGWLFTDADRFPLIYTHKDQTWHYYELGSSKPRYFFNYKSQEWVAWDAIPSESDQVVANR
jgi:hypothetical protein